MPKYLDENGNEVEYSLSPEEAKTLAEKSKQTDEELNQLKEKLAKLENKDYNYKKLREMTEKEKEKMTTKEIEILKRQEKLEEEQANFQKMLINTEKGKLINSYTQGDPVLSKRVEEIYGEFKVDETNQESIQDKIRKAYSLALTEKNSNNLNNVLNKAFSNTTSGLPPTFIQNNKTETEDSKNIRKAFNIKEQDLEKYSGNWQPKFK